MSEYEEDFKQMLIDGGVPVEDAEMDAAFDQVIVDSGVTINNSSPFSPFLRVFKSLIRTPAAWLINSMISTVLPNMFVRTSTDIALDLHAWSVDLERKPASQLTGLIDLTRIDTAGELVIEAGTVIQTAPLQGVIYKVLTTEVVTFADTVASVEVAVEAELAGAAYNLGAGYFNQLLEPISGVSANNAADWITAAGADQESNEALRLRCRNQFTALNAYHTDAVYTKIITEFAGIGVDNLVFESDAPRGPGTANIYLLLDSGEPDQSLLDDLQSHLMDDGNHGHGDDVQILALPSDGQTYNLTASVSYSANYSVQEKTDIKATVQAIIECAFRQNASYSVKQTHAYSTFSFSHLAGEIFVLLDGAASVSFDLADITTALNVARLDALTVEDA